MIKDHCPVCFEKEFILVDTFEQWEKECAVRNKFVALRNVSKKANIELTSKKFYQCSNCKLIFIYPLITNQELLEFYTSYIGNEAAIKKIDKKLKRATRRIKSLMCKSKVNNFLEVGCNVGTAVEAARRLGLNSTGIEIDSVAVTVAKKQYPECKFINISTEEHSEHLEKYDLVFCTEVIEHIPKPNEFVEALYNLVTPGGLLFMTTPDAGHLRRTKKFIHWNEVKPPSHIFWYNKDSLKQLLQNKGFNRIKYRLNLKPGIKLLAFK